MWRLGFLLFCIVVAVNGYTNPNDVRALNALFSNLKSSSQLTNWSPSGGDPCGQQSWKGVTCSESAVTELHLSRLGLSGGMGYSLNTMTSLTLLDLSYNNIASEIPYSLPPNLQRLDLSHNALTGGIPYSIPNMSSLQYLSVSNNQLKSINDFFWNMKSLTTLDLSFNGFSGNLPQSLKSLSSLNTLYLQNNQFTGTINVLGDLPLDNLNVANNHFSGSIPEKLQKIRTCEFGGNSWNSGSAPPSCTSMTSSTESNGGRKKSGIGGGGIAGIILSLLIVGALVAFFLIRRKSRNNPNNEKLEQEQGFTPLASIEHNEMKSVPKYSDVDAIPLEVQNPSPVKHKSPTPPTLKPPPFDRYTSYDGADSAYTPAAKKSDRAPISATIYSVADLQLATGSFSVDNLLGEGSIGRVYRARFDNGKILAVKKIKSLGYSNQATEEFLDVVSNVSRLHHPNVTELVGYCCEHGQHLLAYEFLKNGSLHDFLHLSDEYSRPLTWNTRVKIALGTARALEYLHEACSPSIVHKNFKSANILLDGELNPHLSDCGLSKFSSDLDYQRMDQYLSSGYGSPEVAMGCPYTLKSDVCSFGVVMLELLTGRKPHDSSRPRLEQSLVRWATPQLHDIDALDKMVDPALKGLFPAKSLSRFADVIALCVQSEPEFRPPMSEVVQALVRLVQRANMSKRMGSMDEQDASRRDSDVDMHDMF